MAWTWRYEGPDGSEVEPGSLDAAAGAGGGSFPNQSDAESWVGETWRQLLDAGVHQVTLYEGDRKVYGPMGLEPA